MIKRMTWLLAVVALCVSCQKFAEGRQMFREMLTLRDQLTTEFHEKNVDIKVVNGDHMIVTFINSPFASRSSEEKQQRADAVAAFVATHYKQPMSSVSTQFLTKAGGLGMSVSGGQTYVGKAPPKP